MADSRTTYGGLDVFKLIAAFLVVAIHISPLTTYTPMGDFLLTRVLARVAVPFFFMVTGQFVLGPYLLGRSSFPPVAKALKKLLLLYAFAILLYLPIGLYAGHYQDLSPLSLFRLLVFDGTFYHLWYFPGCILGILVLCLLRKLLPRKGLPVAVLLLYAVALLGDSYYGFTAQLPGLAAAYDLGFQLYSYTRNGLFMAPLFLWMGAVLGQRPHPLPLRKYKIGLALALLAMAAEGLLLHHFQMQRHDSMYLMLPVVMGLLYPLLLSWNPKPSPLCRTLSTWIYVLHPAMLVVLRGGAKVTGCTDWVIGNSLVQYLGVCLLSLLAALAVAFLLYRLRPPAPASQARAWITLDRDALAHNVSTLQALLPKHTRLMPAVKANAYGHGGPQIARELNRLGIHAFCVACAGEGVQLRKAGVKGEILVLGYTHPSQVPLLRRYHLTQTVVDLSYAQELAHYGKPLHVHVAVDTGMHRLGEDVHHLDAICSIFSLKSLRIDGIFTHLSRADSRAPQDIAFTEAQADSFSRLRDALAERGIPCPPYHLLASAGMLHYPHLGGAFARPGLALYGITEAQETSPLSLRPVLSLRARVAAVKPLAQGESAGYGRAFVAPHPMRIAVLTIGYGDGLPRSLGLQGGWVLLHGHRAPILGQLCMDQTIVDVTHLPQTAPGDSAVLIGRDGEETLSVSTLAQQTGTIPNELLSRLSPRLERRIT
ncbi:MAG: serine racemase VanT catalytic subunit [Evtepia sp.]|uniref:serine racemase VanT catalytic subunit n=1 Tax=Evtepia sp. TaxID=2773933 RepID=UPI002A75DB5B|nr:serine racemase VanT catalytic subunit [Evtepia sp.]MDY3014746.1 serine racemase VanT catalytic subunit [Evtepia sp.]